MDSIDDATETGPTAERPNATADPGLESSVPDSSREAVLHAVVVRYESGDRLTLLPRNAAPGELLTSWLTADLKQVVDLDDAR